LPRGPLFGFEVLRRDRRGLREVRELAHSRSSKQGGPPEHRPVETCSLQVRIRGIPGISEQMFAQRAHVPVESSSALCGKFVAKSPGLWVGLWTVGWRPSTRLGG
jgi:hypothetical protein